jgi:hypothetical protein
MSKIERLPGETKEDAKLRAQREAQAEIEANQRATDAAWRGLFTVLRLWKFCPFKRCRHACACSGDATRCYNRFWPLVPEHTKVYLRAYITASARDELPRREAVRHAEQELARYLAMEARDAQDKAEREAAAAARFAPPQPRTVPDHLAPRIWRP